ncbi:MAG: flagellar basal-body rod protein FlgF [Rhodospirillaceae bacterium]
MESSSNIVLSRQTALKREMTAVANNIANLNTTGFKAELMMYDQVKVPGSNGESLSYVIDRGSVRDMRPGSVSLTGNPFDLAITGDGYFSIDNGTETVFTRNGAFMVDKDGKLSTKNGDTVLDDRNNPILVPPGSNSLQIAEDGTIASDGEILGKLQIVSFDSEMLMKSIGDGLLKTDQEPQLAEAARITQGALEGSNVQSMMEMTKLIEIHRSYERMANFIKNEDERQRDLIRRIGRPPQG